MADAGSARIPAILKNKLLSDTIASTLVFFLNRSISFLRGFVVARLLDPSLYGYFSGLSLIFLYNSQAHLGILHGMNRNLSIARGAEDHGSFQALKNNAITAICLLSLVVSCGIVLFSFLKQNEYDIKIIWGMRIYAFVAVMHHLEYLYHSFLRVEHRFGEINISRMLFASSNLLLVVILAKLFSFYGVVAALALSIILQNLYLMSRVRIVPRFTLDWNIIRGLVLTGAPISFAYLIDIILNTVDRLMIVKFLGSEQLGFYGIGLTLSLEFLLRIPETLSYVIYPRILERYGKTRDPADLASFFQAPSVLIGCVMAAAIGFLFLTIDPLITHLLPRYTPAILVSKIIIFSVYFISINQIAVRIIISINRTRLLIVCQVMAIICNVALNYFAISHQYGINGIAVATGLSYFLYSVVVTHFALKMIKTELFASIKKQIGLYLPLGYCVAVIAMISWLTHLQGSLLLDFKLMAVHVFSFAIMVSPMAWYLYNNRQLKDFLRENG